MTKKGKSPAIIENSFIIFENTDQNTSAASSLKQT